MSFPPPSDPGPPGPPPPPPPGGMPPPPPPPGGSVPGGPEIYQYGAPPPTVSITKAPYGKRFVAWLIDGLIVSVLPIVAGIWVRSGPTEIERCEITADGNIAVFGEEGTPGLCEVPTNGTWAITAVIGLAALAFGLWYSAREGSRGAMVGKRAMGLRLVHLDTGHPVGAGKGIGRNLLRGVLSIPLFFGIPFLLDHLWPLWDEKGQTLHDKAVSGVVVPVETVPHLA